LSKPAQPAVAYAQQTGIDPGVATFTWTDPIGGTPADHTFEFVATAGSAASGNAEVLIGAGSVETLEALVTAVNDAGAPGNGDYSATFLVQANKFVHHPRPAGHATLLDPAVTNPPKTPLLVRFLTNSTDVDDVADNDDHIDEVARFLLANPTIKVHVNGYTDIVGENSGFDNDKLSLDRAKAVIEELEDRGVPASQIHKPPKGFGATQFLCPHLPGDSSTVKGQKNAWNRRVEFVLDRSDTHPIMKLQADTAGPNRIEADDVSDLKPLGRDDGHGIIELNTGDAINIDAQTFTVGTDFNRGATPTESAENLADAINGRTYATAAEELSASSSGPTVTVGGEGTVAQIDLTSFLFGTPANDVEVTSTGAARATGFSGGTGAKAPGAGTTVTVGGKVLRLVVDPDDALEAREFRLGPDADATASELARVISTLPKTNATVEDNLITVEAPLGTTFATTDPKVFDLSDKRIGGAAKVKEEEKNQAFAMHANISVTDSRRFGLVVTGTSKITAKLVSLPAPVELLNEVKEFLAEEE
jgi:outer membrane protein OmpA-like peptidoglycan-associated protein